MKLGVDSVTGCVAELVVGGVQCIHPWGFEVGNWRSFFSQQMVGGLLSEPREWDVHVGPDEGRVTAKVHLAGALLAIESRHQLVGPCALERTLTMRAMKPSPVGDLAMRYVFRADVLPVAVSGGLRLGHQSVNRYRDLTETSISLQGPHGAVTVELTGAQVGPFRVVTYVRDEPGGRWIVHHRLIATEAGVLVIKRIRDNRLWEVPPGSFLSRWPLRRLLWLCRERYWPRAPYQMGANALLVPGAAVSLSSRLTLSGAWAERAD